MLRLDFTAEGKEGYGLHQVCPIHRTIPLQPFILPSVHPFILPSIYLSIHAVDVLVRKTDRFQPL